MSLSKPPPGGQPTRERPVVLLVDDDREYRALGREYLRRAAYEVLEASNGAEALEVVGRVEPDVIVIGVLIAERDGLECIRALKTNQSTAHVPVIMASAVSRGADVVAGLEAGADEYITKPFEPKEFCLRVRSMMRLRQAHKDQQRNLDTFGEQNRSLSILFDLSCESNAERNLDSVLARIVSAAAELTGCRDVSVMLPDDGGRLLRPVASASEDISAHGDIAIPIGQGITGRAFGMARPIVYADIDQVRRECHPGEEAFFQGAPILAAPLCTGEDTVGVLSVAGRLHDRPFEPKELAYLDMVVNLAASAVRDILTRQARDAAHESIVIALAKLAEHRDDDTGRHLDRVTQFCLTLAEELRRQNEYTDLVDDAFLCSLRLAAPLHDIGKVAVPDNILLKPGRLTSPEMEIMRRHVEFGAETIRSVRARSPQSHFLQLAEEVCQCHHEWYNGSGYPRGLVATEIPLSARIAALADVYDALTTKRVYKPAMPHRKAFSIIVHASGTQFDPDVVQAFIEREQDFVRLARELADVEREEDSQLQLTGAEASAPGRC